MSKYSKTYKKTHIYIPIFGTNGNIFFDRKKYKKFCEKYHDFNHSYDLNSTNGDCLMNDDKDEFVIGIFDSSKGTLAHELVHITQWILHKSHIDTTESDGETMAHLLKFMFTKIEKRMKCL